jgi:hypothetical protein
VEGLSDAVGVGADDGTADAVAVGADDGPSDGDDVGLSVGAVDTTTPPFFDDLDEFPPLPLLLALPALPFFKIRLPSGLSVGTEEGTEEGWSELGTVLGAEDGELLGTVEGTVLGAEVGELVGTEELIIWAVEVLVEVLVEVSVAVILLLEDMLLADGPTDGNYDKAFEIYEEIQNKSEYCGAKDNPYPVLHRLAIAIALVHATTIIQTDPIECEDIDDEQPYEKYIDHVRRQMGMKLAIRICIV